MLEVRLLGRFEVRRDGQAISVPSRAGQSLFAYLLLNPGIQHRREQLAGLLTPDSSDENARSGLRRALWQLRKWIGPDPDTSRDCFLVDELAIGLDPAAPITLDVNTLTAPAGPGASVEELVAAINAYGGELLPGFYDDWVMMERSRLEAVFENKMRLLLDRLIDEARWSDVLTWGEHWIARGGLPEAAYRALMIAHSAQGDSARAAAVYRRCEEALRSELGVEPAGTTRELYARLARGEGLPGLPPANALPLHLYSSDNQAQVAPDTAAVPDGAPAPGEPPFKGLKYFDTEDAELFFGREALVARLIRRLQERNLLIIVGASGSGKSSLVRAGLIPALMNGATAAQPGCQSRPSSNEWQYRVLTPTSHPLQSLAVALTSDSESVTAAATLADDMARDERSLELYVTRLAAGSGGPQRKHVFLAIDQFEELFTLCRREEERAAYVANLITASEDCAALTLVLTLRADFYAHCAQYPELREALTTGQEYIGAMTPDELCRAIESPAAKRGWSFEPGLVDLLLHDTGGEPGALPLLSHALMETWQRRRGRTMTLQGYAASGGVAGAVARTAQTTYARLTAEQQAACRNIFIRLTELGQGTQDTRRRARLAELFADEASRPLVASVLDILAAARLVTVAEDQAEVAHEALIREWPLLREWLTEDREGLMLHRRLTEAAQSWEELEHDPGELYRGGRLARVLEWSEAHRNDLNPLERSFVAASEEAARAEEREREAQRQRELEAAQKLAAAEGSRAEVQRVSARRLRSRARLLAAALALALVLGAAAALLAARAGENAEHAQQAAELAEAQRTLATVGNLANASSANMAADPQLSLLLAIRAAETAEAAGIPLPVGAEEALHRAVQGARLRATVQGQAGVAVSADGALVATAGGNGEITVWPLAAWSPAGKPRSAADQVLHGMPARGRGERRLAFSGDHRLLADAADGTVTVWNVETASKQAVIEGLDAQIEYLVFSVERDRLAGLDGNGVARVWDARTGGELARAGAADNRVSHIALSDNGGRLAVNYLGKGIEILDVNKARVNAALDTQAVRNTTAMQFCGPGKLIVQALGAVLLWDAETGALLQSFPGLAGLPPAALGCSPDGRSVAVGGRSRSLRLWDIATSREIDTVAPEADAAGVSFSSDGALLITTRSGPGLAPQAQVWEALAGAEWIAFATGGPAQWSAFSPEVGLAAAGVRSLGVIDVWQTSPSTTSDGGTILSRAPLHQFRVLRSTDFLPVALSPKAAYVVRSASGGQAQLSPVKQSDRNGEETQGTVVLPPNPQTGYAALTTLAFDASGARLAGLAEVAGTTVSSVASRLSGVGTPPQAKQALQIWDLPELGVAGKAALHPLPELALPSGPSSAAWSPDGRELAVGLFNGQFALVDPQTGRTRLIVDAHRAGVPGIAYSPDGALIATAGSDGVGRLWSVQRDGETTVSVQPGPDLHGHTAQVLAVAFVEGGARVATASGDGTIRLWDPKTGREQLTLARVPGAIWTLTASRDGTLLAASGADGLRVYVLPVENLLSLARARAARNLTGDEATRFLQGSLQANVPVVTPLPAAALTHEETVRAFVDSWGRGDIGGVTALFDPDFEYALNITTPRDYPFHSIASLRVHVAFWAQAVGGRFYLQGCRAQAQAADKLECAMTYQDECTARLGREPLHLTSTFTFANDRIAKLEGGPSAEEQDERLTDFISLVNWAQSDPTEDWVRTLKLVMSTESEALQAGATLVRLCDNYAAGRPSAPGATLMPGR